MLYHNHFGVLRLLHISTVFTDNSIGTEPQGDSYNEAYRHLSDNLVFSFQTVLVLLENLDVVIHESQESQPDSGNDHEQQIDVAHTA